MGNELKEQCRTLTNSLVSKWPYVSKLKHTQISTKEKNDTPPQSPGKLQETNEQNQTNSPNTNKHELEKSNKYEPENEISLIKIVNERVHHPGEFDVCFFSFFS
jgi:hypothetical protein